MPAERHFGEVRAWPGARYGSHCGTWSVLTFEGGVDLTANKNGEAAEIEPKDEGW